MSRRPGQQRSSTGILGFSHSSHSWSTPNGSSFTIEATSYSSPGLSFGSDAFGIFAPPRRSRTSPVGGGGLLGAAFGILNSMMSGQGQQSGRTKNPQSRRERAAFVEEPEETDSDTYDSDEDLAYGLPQPTEGRPRSVLSRFTDKLTDKLKESGKSTAGTADRETRTEGFAESRPQPAGTQRRTTDAGTAFAESPSSEGYSDDFDTSSTTEDEEPSLAYLQRAVDSEEKAYARALRRYKRGIEDEVEFADLSTRREDVKIQERALEVAERELRKAKLRQQSARPPPSTRPSATRQTSARVPSFVEDFHARFGAPPSRARASPSQPRAQPPPQPPTPQHQEPSSRTSPKAKVGVKFSGFGPFAQRRARTTFTPGDPLTDFDSRFMEGCCSSSSTGTARPQTQPRPRTSAHSREPPRDQPRLQPQPPPVVPAPRTYPVVGSAARYENYNKRWLALAADSPSISFPTPTYSATSLSNASTIPYAGAPAWSMERIMQANTQLYFVQALGLTPVISDKDGIVEIKGKEEAKKELLDVLKRERVRWHSDKLGRRNSGCEDLNEYLQKDERCRAVFHGVCGLAEICGKKA